MRLIEYFFPGAILIYWSYVQRYFPFLYKINFQRVAQDVKKFTVTVCLASD